MSVDIMGSVRLQEGEVNSLGSLLKWWFPVHNLRELAMQGIVDVRSGRIRWIKGSRYTLCPARLTALATMSKPRLTGGCNPTTPSDQNTASFRGGAESLAVPLGSALDRCASTTSCRKGIGT